MADPTRAPHAGTAPFTAKTSPAFASLRLASVTPPAPRPIGDLGRARGRSKARALHPELELLVVSVSAVLGLLTALVSVCATLHGPA